LLQCCGANATSNARQATNRPAVGGGKDENDNVNEDKHEDEDEKSMDVDGDATLIKIKYFFAQHQRNVHKPKDKERGMLHSGAKSDSGGVMHKPTEWVISELIKKIARGN